MPGCWSKAFNTGRLKCGNVPGHMMSREGWRAFFSQKLLHSLAIVLYRNMNAASFKYGPYSVCWDYQLWWHWYTDICQWIFLQTFAQAALLNCCKKNCTTQLRNKHTREIINLQDPLPSPSLYFLSWESPFHSTSRIKHKLFQLFKKQTNKWNYKIRILYPATEIRVNIKRTRGYGEQSWNMTAVL